MAVLDEGTIKRIKSQLKQHSKGMMISDLSRIMKISRNIMSKYLDILLMSGEVEMEVRGNAKIYTISRRVPLSTMFDSSSDYIIQLDRKGRILWLNSALLAFLGKNPGDFAGKTLSETDDPFLQCLQGIDSPDSGDIVTEIPYPVHSETQYFRIKQTPAVLADGSMGSILNCEDITAEKVFQQMVELSKARFRAIVEDQTEFIVRFLPGGTLTFVNGSYARLMEKQPDELAGMQFFLNIPEEDVSLFEEKIRTLDPDHAVATIECSLLPENGTVRKQQWTIRALFNGIGNLTEYQGVGRDITEQVETEESLRRYAADMEFISRKSREFLELPPDADIYPAIAEGLNELLPKSYITISSANPPSPALTVRHVCGVGARETFRQITGTDLVGITFVVNDPTAIEFMKTKGLHKAYGDLFTGFFGQVPYLVCKQIEKALNIDEIYYLGLISQGQLLGDIAILPQRGTGIPNPGLVDAFLHQVSLVLAWRKADESLRKSEALFRAIVEDQTEFVTRFLPDGTLTYVNGSYARFMGRRPEALVGAQHIPYLVNEVIPLLSQRFPSSDLNNLVTTAQCSVLNPAGNVRWQQWTVRALFNERGDLTEYQGVGRDITELHEADESTREHIASMEFLSRKTREFLELPRSADIYRTILFGLNELVPDATITVNSFDPHRNAIVARGALPTELPALFRNLTNEELLEKYFIVSDPDAIERMKYNQIKRIPGDLYYAMFGAVSMAVSRKIEEACSMSEEKYAIGLVAQNRLLGSVLIIPKKGHALANRLLIETFIRQASVALAQRLDAEALRQSEARFRAAVEDQTEFVTRFLPDGTLTFVNAPLCRAVQKEPGELLGQSFFSMIPDDVRQEVTTTLQSLNPENPKATIRHRVIGPDGEIRWFEWTNRAIFDDQGHTLEYDGIGRDITELHDASARIRKHPAEIKFLSRHARELAGIQNAQEVLSFTAKKIQSVLPDSLVGICSYTPVSKELLFRYIEGNPEVLGALNFEIRQDLTGTVFAFDADPDMLSQFSSRRLVPGSRHIGQFFSSVSPDVCARVAERLNLGRSYLMGLPSSDGTMDSILIQLEAGTDLQNPELIEAAINQAGLALARMQEKPE